MKKHCKNFIFIIGALLIFQSCNKSDNETNKANCYVNDVTTRQVVNKQATIQVINGQFYIIESNTIDEKLRPCNLAIDFQINNLQVIVSGNVKATPQIGMPCCTQNFVITSITK
ncbi:MAG: hypothetical protein H7101_00575 [Deinococcales bacterium]|nr:hypothetical protein [Chitinophagaceae bacterium]